ncbi:chemotaxis protein CheX [Stieleria sp. JC731]|uniref:chemotaxis protein CheX n=1 Tax=Pirellulaceae TaxID=2691357 RepID=UPI001E3A9227|nr:chemotaxis protein CheX [Stieleria sp. JC731]MCC9599031.1 chemotaxis protein CheX [Stieleria sp. JC731]
MNQYAKDICTQCIFQSLTELLEYYSEAEVTVQSTSCDSLAAVFNETIECPTIGCETIASMTRLDGTRFSGSLTLTSHACVIAKLCRQELQFAPDWIGELGNQILGRFKNNLLDYGVDTHLGIPLTSRGILLNNVTCPGDQLELKASTNVGNVWVTFALQVAQEESRWRKLPQSAAATAGSLQLF